VNRERLVRYAGVLPDPEDLQMHYTRMLCLRGLGDAANAAREQALFQRFKADERQQTQASAGGGQ
jgi:hypothetical protein